MSPTPHTERTIGIIVFLVAIARSLMNISQLREELTHTKQELLIAQQQNSSDTTSPSDTLVVTEEGVFTDNTGAMFTPISGEILKADLLLHPELIPYSGVLGGTMNFYNEDMTIIGDKWIIAYFEDGHIGGYALYTYTRDENTISWKLLDSYIL